MQELKAIVIDDESDARALIKLLLGSHFPLIQIIGEADSVSSASTAISHSKPDLIFLDIEMPDGTGFDLINLFSNLYCPVIFVTAFDHYAIKAIKASAFDYILKPVNLLEFKRAVKRAVAQLQEQQKSLKAKNLITELQQHLQVRKIALPTLTGYQMEPVERIVRAEADNNYSIIHFDDETIEVISRSLSKLEQLLTPYGFQRIHHKHLVSLNHIKSYVKGVGGGSVILTNGEALEVSARKKHGLLGALAKA